MKYCTHCGHSVHQKIPAGDNRLRYVCDNCQAIHYQNPRIVAGCLASWEQQVLLCRRAIEPCRGLWTLPAGFMENGETIAEAAIRETREEACVQVQQAEIYMLFSLPRINQATLIFRAQMNNGSFGIGDESLEVKLFSEDEIPWDRLAFTSTSQCLRHYFSDRKQQRFPVRNLELAE